jgi:putative MFS transporter
MNNIREVLKNKLVWIAALGYFVDLFDLVLYGVVRVSSLREIGVSENDLFSVGASLLNYQMGGMLVGGFIWGAIADKHGRREALFGSILLYSLATFANAFVTDINTYAFLRFVAGFGLAGELGAAITMVSEALPQKNRGLGSAFIATVGFAGAALSSLITQHISWQHAYQLGGILGITLLITRVSVHESSLFISAKKKNAEIAWGSFKQIILSKPRAKIFIFGLIAGVPIWYVAGILSYFAPEFGRGFRLTGEVTAGNTIMVGYIGAMLGDVACGLLSQYLQSRKKAVFIFMMMGASMSITSAFFLYEQSPFTFYLTRMIIGFGNGFFAMLIAWMAEVYGTNLRATVAITLSNLIRGSVIPLTFTIQYLREPLGLIQASVVIGIVCFGSALIATLFIPETFHRELDYLER